MSKDLAVKILRHKGNKYPEDGEQIKQETEYFSKW